MTATASAELSAPTEVSVLSLDRVAEKEGLSVSDRIALGDAELRKLMAERMLQTFGWANAVALATTVAFVVLDQVNLALGLIPAGNRIVTQQVLMALLGATTVQVGTIAVIIARYLFPGRSREG